VSQAKGLSLNSKKIRAEKAGVAVTDRSFMNMDIQMCTSVPHMFTIGEMIGEVALAIEMGADAVGISARSDSPASHAGREHRHGGGSGAWQLHGCATGAQVDPQQPSY
jgi:hypothetical protein